MHKYGFLERHIAVPKLKLADCQYNLSEIIAMADRAWDQGVGVTLSGAGDHRDLTVVICFFNGSFSKMRSEPWTASVNGRRAENADGGGLLPLAINGSLYNCAALVNDGKILGSSPKPIFPIIGNMATLVRLVKIPESYGDCHLFTTVPIGTDLLFQHVHREEKRTVVAIEICRLAWCLFHRATFTPWLAPR